MRMMTLKSMLFLLLLLSGCKSDVPIFSGERAFGYLVDQCQFGPRNPGSEGYRRTSIYIQEQLQGADTVFVQPFSHTLPETGKTYALGNIIARFQPDSEKQILVSAHWDTRPWSDQDPDPENRNKPVLGANDGASGVAVLLELAHIFKTTPPPFGVTLVFWDGEDMGRSGDSWSYAKGAQFFAQNLPFPRPEYAINLDMVGDAELELYIERISFQQNPQLVRSLWKLAQQLGLSAFRQEVRHSVFDDHVPLYELGGIPAVNIIDFDYPNAYKNYWHTQADLPEHCSAVSLGQVGTLLVHHIYGGK